MAAKKKPGRKVAKVAGKKAAAKARSKGKAPRPAARQEEVPSQPFLRPQLGASSLLRGMRRTPLSRVALRRRLRETNVRPKIDEARLLRAINHIKPESDAPVDRLPEEIRESLASLKSRVRRFHGAKASLAWFRRKQVFSSCADKFGYLTSKPHRLATRLPFNANTQALLDELGNLMGDPGRDLGGDSTIPAGFTYVGQFVDHDITLDISSSLETAADATTINNMRTPVLDLDSVYGDGPALHPYLYAFPESGPASAIKLQLGENRPTGPGGPAGNAGSPAGMQVQTDFDLPRVRSTLNPASATNTAIIGDPRNDENLIVSQFHHTMLRFHNEVVDLLVLAGFSGDIFVEAKKIATHHYQWAVVHDFLSRICGSSEVSNALASVSAPIDSPFSMPVEFAVGAYRFGHSMIRENYWVNFNFPNATLGQVFDFSRNPNLPVLSNWVVDFNAFFDTGVPVPVNNRARPIDSVLSPGLESLPGLTGMMAVLARRNLRRGLSLGLPSGQGVAAHFGISPMSDAQLEQGLPAAEVALLGKQGGLLKKKTPLWYYVLREAAVLGGGNQLGPVGARIVAETFVRMLKRDAGSYLNVAGGFTPMLPSATPGDFTFADLVTFAGVTQP